MRDDDLSPLLVATGPFGLVGRVLMDRVPDLVPLDILPSPEGIATRHSPAVALPPVDITDASQVSRALSTVAAAANGRPLVVIHFAALTDTRGGDESLFEKVNVYGTENVLSGARKAGASFIHLSTDYVFAGESDRGSIYGEDDRPLNVPPGVYAASKFRAENLVLDADFPGAVVVRIAFPYGGLGNRPGLTEKMLLRFQEARRKSEPVKLFQDQTICPAYIPDIVRGLLLLARALPGSQRIFHLVGEPTTPLAFGGLIRRAFGFEDVPLEAVSVQGTSYAENLRLSSAKTRAALGWTPLSHAEALRAMLSSA